jgi:hypothetical protein
LKTINGTHMLSSVTSQNSTNMNAVFKIWHAYCFVELGFEFNMLYCLHNTSRPFFSGYFGDGGLTNYLPVWASNYDPPVLSLPVARIAGMKHWCPASMHTFKYRKPFVCLCIYLVWQHWGFTSTPQANYPLSQFFSFFYVVGINKVYFIFYKLFIRILIIWGGSMMTMPNRLVLYIGYIVPIFSSP